MQTAFLFLLCFDEKIKTQTNTQRARQAMACVICAAQRIHCTFDAFSFYLQLASHTIYFLMITIIPIILEFLHCSYKKNVPLLTQTRTCWQTRETRSSRSIEFVCLWFFIFCFSLLIAKLALNREYGLDNCFSAKHCSISSGGTFLITHQLPRFNFLGSMVLTQHHMHHSMRWIASQIPLSASKRISFDRFWSCFSFELWRRSRNCAVIN